MPVKRVFLRLIEILVVFCFILCSCNKEKLFTSLSHRRTGIDFKNIIEDSEQFNVLDYPYFYNGGGVAVGDINNDGLPDLFFSGNLSSSKLYLNKGNFRFEDITERSHVICGDKWNTGVTMADINGDGFLDIYVCSAFGRPTQRRNLFFINNGDLTFTESAVKYGIEGSSYSTHCVFFDFDKDGDLRPGCTEPFA